jgi:SAM-dependent methyltransferase
MEAYYRPDLAMVHDQGFGFHADRCAPGILALLEPVRARGGLVLEIGCGSGRLTRHLVDAGHRVIATDASPAMLALARTSVSDASICGASVSDASVSGASVSGASICGVEVRRITLPDDPLPEADAVVGVGHALNYLPDEAAVRRGLVALAGAVRPGGVLALDLCDLAWGAARRGEPDLVRLTDDWALFSRFSVPSPDRFVREMTTFVRTDDGSWRRDDERHDNVLLDTARIPELLATRGIAARIGTSFGGEELPVGLVTVVGHRPSGAPGSGPADTDP